MVHPERRDPNTGSHRKPTRRSALLGAVSVMLALAVAPSSSIAQFVHQPVKGYVTVHDQEITCAHPSACFFCINDENTTGDHRLIVAIGSDLAGVEVLGFVEGVIDPFVELDGVTLTPELLPVGAFIRAGLRWSDLPFAPSCDARPPGVTYEIGGIPETSESGDGGTIVDIPIEEARGGIPFRFTICSQLIYVGAGCNLSGSSPNSFQLHLPGTLNAFVIDPGDSPPIAPAGADVVVDLEDAPGGTLTVARMDGEAPLRSVLMGPEVHWDLRTDMPQGSYSAGLTLSFDPATLPVGVEAGDLLVTVFDETLGAWTQLPTSVDEAAGTATANVEQFGVTALSAPLPVPIRPTTWGALKARF